MESRALPSFRKALSRLPHEIQELAAEAYALWKANPRHPSLRFKKVSSNMPIYSVRISGNYRALGRLRDGTMYWFWIGPHSEYDQILKQL